MRLNAFVGVTDHDWFRFLSSLPGIDEVNFWKPGGETNFKALTRGEPFLFKLHAPWNAIAGGGFFGHFSRLPASLAWETFGVKNGAPTYEEMRRRIEKYRRTRDAFADYTIGCILLEEPFFFAESDWVPAPAEWKPNIVQGRGYDLSTSPGRELWAAVAERMARVAPRMAQVAEPAAARYGTPSLVAPRLGQGTFRILVTDAYQRRCAITREKTLPVLQAAHIRPYSAQGEHRVDNGLLLRSDLHTLFDRGYLTVTPSHEVEVSRRIREEFENGRDYYALHGQRIELPGRAEDRPNPAFLDWHASNVFRG